MEAHAFASLAQVRILLLPVDPIQRSTFDHHAKEIRTFNDIRLGDIPVHGKDGKARFMPSPLSTGHLHLCHISHPPPQNHGPLSLFRPSHFPLGVIGIATCSETGKLSSVLAQFDTLLRDVFPPDSLFPFAKNLFVFEESGANALDSNLTGLVIIPSGMGNKKLYIGALLADLCSHILGEFGQLVQTLETPFGNEYLNSTLFPLLSSSSELQIFDSNSKRDSFQPPSQNTAPDLNYTASPKPSVPIATNPRQQGLNVPTPPKKRTSFGVASSHGRLYKVLGDFFLLSGKTEDAMIWYTEAVASLKAPQDSTWLASALEGMTTISLLDAWSSGYGIHTPTGNGDEPWSGLSDKLTQAVSLYSKATPADSDNLYSLLTYLYCSAVLRHTSLLFSVWSSKGWGPLAFAGMLRPSSTPYLPPTVSFTSDNSWLNLEHLTLTTGISRAQISSVLAQCHGPWLLHLGAIERLAILESMAAMYACLGYKRKEAYLLREVLGCIMDLLVCGRREAESLHGATSSTSEAQGSHRTSESYSHGSVSMRRSETTEGNESLIKVLSHACQVLGVDVEAIRSASSSIDDRGDKDLSLNRTSTNELEALGISGPQDPFGWPELQVGIVREAIAVAESLPDHLAVAQFALSALHTLHSVMTAADQYYLYTVSARALATTRRRGSTQRFEFWSGWPIVSIAISPLASVRLPTERPISALTTQSSELNAGLPGANGPFLYNPRKLNTDQGRHLIVQNEPFELEITLQNPFLFDLEFQNLSIITSGVPVVMDPASTTVPASSMHTLSLVGQPLEPGLLTIRGCAIQTPESVPREFILPLSTEETEEKRSQLRSALDCETGRFKYSGLCARPWEKERARKRLSLEPSTSTKMSNFLECKVVPEQPLLRIRRTSLTHGALMLYNGEMSTIRMTLENVSTLPIKFFSLYFDDSTKAAAQQALVDGDLSIFDAYETEYDLIHRPMFSWQNQAENGVIGPGQAIAVTLTCLGKVGCTEGVIHIVYSLEHRGQDLPGETFYSRQISYPVMVTVYHMLECDGMDILPYTYADTSDRSNEEGTRRPLTDILRVDDEFGWCLFSIEVRNTYGLPFDVTFERSQEGLSNLSVTHTVAPGSTRRIVIPIKKFHLPDDQVTQQIPTLTDRQFVVSKSALSSVEERTQRELFWYREEVFKCVRGRWQETEGTRYGNISLRGQRFSLTMLERLRTEKVRVQMTLVDCNNDNEPVVRRGGVALACPNEFLCLQTIVTNLSLTTSILTLSFAVDPAQYVICEGILSDIPLGQFDSRETRQIDIGVCFLACGRFEMTAKVRCHRPKDSDSSAGIGELRALIRERK